ncbi:hypothetical protein PMIN02_008422 [Paraphaeosphaeria minitans]
MLTQEEQRSLTTTDSWVNLRSCTEARGEVVVCSSLLPLLQQPQATSHFQSQLYKQLSLFKSPLHLAHVGYLSGMHPNKLDPSPADIAELQRDCHPFPAYIDAMYGRPTEYERLMGNPESARINSQDENPPSSKHAATGNLMVSAPYQYQQTNRFQHSASPAPVPAASLYPSPQSMYAVPPSSRLGNIKTSRVSSQPPEGLGQSLQQQQQQQQQNPSLFGGPMKSTGGGWIGGAPTSQTQSGGALGQNKIGSSPPSLFACGLAPTQLPAGALPQSSAPSLAPPPNPVSRMPSAPTAPKTPVRILGYNDLWKPAFNWIPRQVRTSSNEKVGRLHGIIANENAPMSTRNLAKAQLIELSGQVMVALKLTIVRKMHQAMPSLYDAVLTRHHYPSHHPETLKANEAIHKIRQQFPGPPQEYMTGMFQEMVKRGKQGKVPYEAIPGWLEQWNREHAPKATNENAATRNDELELSKGESSPLPRWRDS